jgi:D-lactate dehydrogenase (cytochrome)
MRRFFQKSKYIRNFSQLEEFKKILGSTSYLSTNPNILAHHGTDVVGHTVQPPNVVVFPQNINHISEITKICNRDKIPIIPYGAGTSLEGNFTAPRGGVCFDLQQMNKIVKIHSEDMDVIVEAGITREDLNRNLKETGLFFPIDPGANAT